MNQNLRLHCRLTKPPCGQSLFQAQSTIEAAFAAGKLHTPKHAKMFDYLELKRQRVS